MAENNCVKTIGIGLVVIGIDQLTKYWAATTGLVTLNTGVSLGIFQEVPSILMVIGLIAVLVAVYLSFKDFWNQHTTTAAIFFSAAASNLIDRAVYQGVRDWLPIPFTNLYNNIADWVLFFAILCMLLLIKAEKKANDS